MHYVNSKSALFPSVNPKILYLGGHSRYSDWICYSPTYRTNRPNFNEHRA
jgi:hypothetical protein